MQNDPLWKLRHAIAGVALALLAAVLLAALAARVLGDLIECPLHQAQYRLDTGELVEGPECPALRTYRLIEQDGRWYVET